MNLHSYDTVIIITGDMKPCAGVNKSGIPTLKNTIGIF